MLYKLETEQGQISVDRNVVIQIIDQLLIPFRGRVWLANYRGTVVDLVSRIGVRDILDDPEIYVDEKGISVRLYLVIRFGVSIRTVTGEIIDAIREALSQSIELPVNEITVVVTGTMSKNIAKRNIEIKG